jgi:hypothetical protein
MTPSEAINILVDEKLDEFSFYSEKAKVTAVDETAGTCTVTLAADDAEITDVPFKTEKDNVEGIFITPTVGKYVMISFLNNEIAFVSLIQDYDKVTIKKGGISIVIDGSNVVVNAGSKTVALAPDVVTRLKILEDDLNTLKAAMTPVTGWVVAPGDGGAALQAAVAAWLAATLTNTVDGDIESTNFKG